MAQIRYDGTVIPESGDAANQRWGSSATENLVGTSVNDVIGSGGGNDTMAGGAGDDTYYVQSANDLIVERTGEGIDTVQAWKNMTAPANVENLKVSGDGLYAAGNVLDNLLVGGDGKQQLYGGLGQDVLLGGAASDTFIIVKGEGNDAIGDFNVNEDIIRLYGTGYTSFEQVKAAMTQVGADVRLSLGGNDGLMIRNVTVDQFKATNFALQLDRSKLGSMTFNDDFNSISFYDRESNPTGTWRPDLGYQGSQGSGSYTLANNGEQQIYTSPYFRDHPGDFNDGNFRVNADGTMSIIAHDSTNPEIFGAKYTSGYLSTLGDQPWLYSDAKPTFAQQYGYFEMRADIPETQGTWGAFWLIPSNWSWPPEIDVTENPQGDPNLAFTTAHSNASGSHTSEGQGNYIPGQTEGMHTYGVLWTPETLTYYIDDVQVYQIKTPADMNQPMSLIVNLAVGGWAGNVSGPLNAEMKVDYIRAYALPGGTTPAPVDPTPTTPDPVPPHVDPVVTLSGDVTRAEGTGGATEFVYTVTRTGDLSQGSMVDYWVWGSKDATADDFSNGFPTGTVYFSAGEGTKQIRVLVNGDSTVEGDEQFQLNLSNFRGASAGATTSAYGNITNDDATVVTTLGRAITGNSGNNNLLGSNGNDTISGGGGKDTIQGGLGSDKIDGGTGADIIRGGQGNDTILGGNDNDWLSGDRGADRLTGGFGADTFHSFADNGTDLVTDFSRAQGDRILLDAGTHYSATQVGADTVVTLTDDAGHTGSITLAGVNLSGLGNGWIFVG